jgi:hypothetical protein
MKIISFHFSLFEKVYYFFVKKQSLISNVLKKKKIFGIITQKNYTQKTKI